jgi:hypothetical protein
LQSTPITAPGNTCAKAQMRVPLPIDSLSTSARSWIRTVVRIVDRSQPCQLAPRRLMITGRVWRMSLMSVHIDQLAT